MAESVQRWSSKTSTIKSNHQTRRSKWNGNESKSRERKIWSRTREKSFRKHLLSLPWFRDFSRFSFVKLSMKRFPVHAMMHSVVGMSPNGTLSPDLPRTIGFSYHNFLIMKKVPSSGKSLWKFLLDFGFSERVWVWNWLICSHWMSIDVFLMD